MAGHSVLVCTVGALGLAIVTAISLRVLSQPLAVATAQYLLVPSGMTVEGNTSVPPLRALYHLILDKVVRSPTVLLSDWQKV